MEHAQEHPVSQRAPCCTAQPLSSLLFIFCFAFFLARGSVRPLSTSIPRLFFTKSSSSLWQHDRKPWPSSSPAGGASRRGKGEKTRAAPWHSCARDTQHPPHSWSSYSGVASQPRGSKWGTRRGADKARELEAESGSQSSSCGTSWQDSSYRSPWQDKDCAAKRHCIDDTVRCKRFTKKPGAPDLPP